MLVEGAVIDQEGPRPAYVRFRAGQIVETGQLGTDSSHGRERRLRGIVLPSPVNGHTHLGDAVSTREPPLVSVGELVRPPQGFKFRLLRDSTRDAKIVAMRHELERMVHEGVGATIDFREEGVPGVLDLRRAAGRILIQVVALGRPLARPADSREISRLLRVADGVGLSGALEEPSQLRQAVARECRRRGKRFALHASEEVREDPASFLRPPPDLLVHLTQATDDDLDRIAHLEIAVAVCPRSNALFRRRPPIARMARAGVRLLLGTDNAMLHAPSIWREMEFAYVTSRYHGEPVAPETLVRATCVTPWEWLHQPREARIAPGGATRPLILRLPPDDPAYQAVTRTTEHVMLRPERASD